MTPSQQAAIVDWYQQSLVEWFIEATFRRDPRKEHPSVSEQEQFRPIAVRYDPSLWGRWLFAVRCLIDLQVRTVYGFLRSKVPQMQGSLLDVGCGESPYAHLLSPMATYTGVDIATAPQFGMHAADGIVSYDGKTLPFPDEHFDHIMCTEVLEHVEDPAVFVTELRRVLKDGGTLVATIPFSARVHYEPFDFQRFTNWGLMRLFATFRDVQITPRGSDLVSISAKLIVVAVRLARPSADASLLWRLPALLVFAPAVGIALAIAHVALAYDLGSKSDPLGYSIFCVR
jgi:SAM-dependent methyltransferase